MDNLQPPIKGERPRVEWGAAVVNSIKLGRIGGGGGGIVISEDTAGTAIRTKKKWPTVRSLLPFPQGSRWAFGIRVWMDDGAEDPVLMVTIYNLIMRTGQNCAVKEDLTISLSSTTFTGTVQLLIDWANYPATESVSPFSLVLSEPTLTATQELVPLYRFKNGAWTIDYIHGLYTGQGWMPTNWVGDVTVG